MVVVVVLVVVVAVVLVVVLVRGGFNGRPLVQWPTRPLGGWTLEAPGPRGPGRLNFGLQLQSPDWNLN